MCKKIENYKVERQHKATKLKYINIKNKTFASYGQLNLQL